MSITNFNLKHTPETKTKAPYIVQVKFFALGAEIFEERDEIKNIVQDKTGQNILNCLREAISKKQSICDSHTTPPSFPHIPSPVHPHHLVCCATISIL